MQEQADKSTNPAEIKKCQRQYHDPGQLIQYLCIQEACYGANRLVCRKCFRKYHFSHTFFPLRDNFNLVKSQNEQQQVKSLKNTYQKELSKIPEIQIEVKQMFETKIKIALRLLNEEIRLIGQDIFDQNLLARTIQTLKYSQGKNLNDDFVQKNAKIIKQISSQEQNKKLNEQNKLMKEVTHKINSFKKLTNVLCQNYFQELLKIVKSFKHEKTYKKQQLQQKDQNQVQKNKKQKLKAKIGQKESEIVQQNKLPQKLNSQQNKQQNKNLQKVGETAQKSSKKKQKLPERNNLREICFDNPSEGQIDKKLRQLKKEKQQHKDLHIYSIKIKFDAIKAFIPKVLLQNVPQILQNLKVIKIDMYQTFKQQLLRKVVQNFSDLQQLSITGCQSYSEELIDLIIKKNPNLKRFYTLFNFSQHFTQYLKNEYFKSAPLSNRISISQCMKLAKLKNLQNIHVFDCNHQLTPSIIYIMRSLKQITFGGFKAIKQDGVQRYQVKRLEIHTLQALQSCKNLKAVSFFNVQVDTCINSDKLFKWVKGPGKNLKMFIVDGFKRFTDVHTRLLAKQCAIQHLIVKDSKKFAGKFISHLRMLKSLVLMQTITTQKTLSISKKQYRCLENLSIMSGFNKQFFQLFRNLKFFVAKIRRGSLQFLDLDIFQTMKKLQTVIFNSTVTKQTILRLLQNCPKLKRIYMKDIYSSLNKKENKFLNLQKEQFNKISVLFSKLTHIKQLTRDFRDYDELVSKLMFLQVGIDRQAVKNLKKLLFLQFSYGLMDQQAQAYLIKKNIGVYKQIYQKQKQLIQQKGEGQVEKEVDGQLSAQVQEQQGDQQEVSDSNLQSQYKQKVRINYMSQESDQEEYSIQQDLDSSDSEESSSQEDQ